MQLPMFLARVCDASCTAQIALMLILFGILDPRMFIAGRFYLLKRNVTLYKVPFTAKLSLQTQIKNQDFDQDLQQIILYATLIIVFTDTRSIFSVYWLSKSTDRM